jgi:cell division protein YceG involved in septum cleavage
MGLPPGPICIPPTEVVDAVLNRDKNNYIFITPKEKKISNINQRFNNRNYRGANSTLHLSNKF